MKLGCLSTFAMWKRKQVDLDRYCLLMTGICAYVLGVGSTGWITNQLITSWSGSLQSPNYSMPYPENLTCTWTLSVSLGNKIKISILDIQFTTENGTCGKDYIEFRDGLSQASSLIGVYCAIPPPPPFTSTGSDVWFKLVTDEVYDVTARGFTLRFDGVCNNLLTSPSGSITSPNYPNRYPSNLDCMWVIQLHPTAIILLTIHELHVEEDVEDPDRCAYDYVELRAGTIQESPLLVKYCGYVNATMVTRQGNLTVLFVSDGDKEEVGLNFSYTSKINGSWSQWTDWSRCSATCYYGNQARSRVCQNPAPHQGYTFGGCEGDHEGTVQIERRECLDSTCKTAVWTSMTSYNVLATTSNRLRIAATLTNIHSPAVESLYQTPSIFGLAIPTTTITTPSYDILPPTLSHQQTMLARIHQSVYPTPSVFGLSVSMVTNTTPQTRILFSLSFYSILLVTSNYLQSVAMVNSTAKQPADSFYPSSSFLDFDVAMVTAPSLLTETAVCTSCDIVPSTSRHPQNIDMFTNIHSPAIQSSCQTPSNVDQTVSVVTTNPPFIETRICPSLSSYNILSLTSNHLEFIVMATSTDKPPVSSFYPCSSCTGPYLFRVTISSSFTRTTVSSLVSSHNRLSTMPTIPLQEEVSSVTCQHDHSLSTEGKGTTLLLFPGATNSWLQRTVFEDQRSLFVIPAPAQLYSTFSTIELHSRNLEISSASYRSADVRQSSLTEIRLNPTRQLTDTVRITQSASINNTKGPPTIPANDTHLFLIALSMVILLLVLITTLFIVRTSKKKTNQKPKKPPPDHTSFCSVSHHMSARDVIYGGPLMYDLYKPRTGDDFFEFEIDFDSGNESISGDTQELGFGCEMPEECDNVVPAPNGQSQTFGNSGDRVEEECFAHVNSELEEFCITTRL